MPGSEFDRAADPPARDQFGKRAVAEAPPDVIVGDRACVARRRDGGPRYQRPTIVCVGKSEILR